MTCASPSVCSPSAARAPRRSRSRWWLAGLLVGCLLPALGQAEALRLAERLTQICLMAPEAIRAESRRVAHRQARRCLPHRRTRRLRVKAPGARRPALGRPCADNDVLNRRGPPRWGSCAGITPAATLPLARQ